MFWTDTVRIASGDVAETINPAAAALSLANDASWSRPLRRAIGRARQALLARQLPSGSFFGSGPGDPRLQCTFILLSTFLADRDDQPSRAAARRLLELQRGDGGWSRTTADPLDLSTSVLAYFALKLAGHEPSREPLVCARRAILARGGAAGADAAARDWLALLGQIPYEAAAPCAVERVLLSSRQASSRGRSAARVDPTWLARSIVAALRPRHYVPPARGIRELLVTEPRNWPRPVASAAGQDHVPPRESRWLAGITSAMGRTCRTHSILPLRRRALAVAREELLARVRAWSASAAAVTWDELAWSIVALETLGYTTDTPPRQSASALVDAMLVQDGASLCIQSRIASGEDTAICVTALTESGLDSNHADVRRATDWLARTATDGSRPTADMLHSLVVPSTQQRCVDGSLPPGLQLCRDEDEGAENVRTSSNEFLPVPWAACPPLRTAAGKPPLAPGGKRSPGRRSSAMDETATSERTAESVQRTLQLLLDRQGPDGAWGLGDASASNRIAVHPACNTATADSLSALAHVGGSLSAKAMARAVAWLRSHQQPDGSWRESMIPADDAARDDEVAAGAIVVTSRVLVALCAAGVPVRDEAVAAAAEWLFAHQQPSGGWGELASWCPDYIVGEGPPTPRHSGLAVLGLLAAGYVDHEAVARGVQFLLNTQQDDGTWNAAGDGPTSPSQEPPVSLPLREIAEPLLALSRWATQGRCAVSSKRAGHNDAPMLRLAETCRDAG